MSAAPRIPALDGIRACALLAVMLYHANLLGAGWLGVQVFFVLSGYLITGVLMRGDGADDAIGRLTRFHVRRVCRIVPPYAALLLVAVIAAPRLDAVDGIGHAAYFGYNVYLSGVEDSGSRWLAHLWSISLEEHFYLLWPLLIVGLPSRWRAVACWAIVLLAPMCRMAILSGWLDWIPPVNRPYAAAVLTPAQLDAFAWGALACLYQPLLTRWRGLGPASLALFGGALASGMWVNGVGAAPEAEFGAPLTLGWPNTLPSGGQGVWGFSLINVLAASAIACVVARRAATGWLGAGWLRRIGRLSYAGYLVHYPLAHAMSPLVLAIHERTGAGFYASIVLWFPLFAGAVWLFALLSESVIERPFLRWRDRIAPLP